MWWAPLLNSIVSILNTGAPVVVTPPVSGYSLWLDAADTSTITSSSNAVSNWLDKSTNAYNFAQSTAAYKPTTNTRTINSKNVIDFDGTADGLKLTSAATVMNYLSRTATTWFFVGISDSTTTAYSAFATEAGSTSRTGILYIHNASDKIVAACDGGDNGGGGDNRAIYAVTSTTSVNTNAFYTTVKSDPTNATAASRAKIQINAGSDEGTNTATGTAGAYNTENPMTIGYLWDNYGGGDTSYYFWNGAIAEILIYPSALSGGDITSVKSYLATKWGI